jgi:hypothetical protein
MESTHGRQGHVQAGRWVVERCVNGLSHYNLMILNDRFGKDWCLSPEHSLNLHLGNWTVPKQLLVRTLQGGNKPRL